MYPLLCPPTMNQNNYATSNNRLILLMLFIPQDVNRVPLCHCIEHYLIILLYVTVKCQIGLTGFSLCSSEQLQTVLKTTSSQL